MQQKARMTFRFDGTSPRETNREPAGAEHSETGKRSAAKPEAGAKPTDGKNADYEESTPAADEWQAWHSPYQDDIRALEEIIRNPRRDFDRKPPQPEAGTVEAGKEKARRGEHPHPEEPVAETGKLYSFSAYMQPKTDESIPVRGQNITWSFPSEEPPTVRGYDAVESGEARDPWEEGEEDGPFADTWNGTRSPERTPSWWRVIASVAGALLTGGLFGYLLLNLFAGEPLFPAEDEYGRSESVMAPLASDGPAPASPAGTGIDASGAPAANPEANDPTDAAAQAAEVPGFTFHMLQYGVFRTEASMQEALAALDAKGVAAAGDTTDGYRVFAGAAATKEEAELLATQLNGTDVYIKPIESVKLSFSGAQSEPNLPEFLDTSSALYLKLIGMTSDALMAANPQPFSSGDMQTVETLRNAWTGAAGSVDEWDAQLRQPAKTAANELNEALKSLAAYNEKPDRSTLWSVQSSVMSAVLADRQLRMTVSLESGS